MSFAYLFDSPLDRDDLRALRRAAERRDDRAASLSADDQVLVQQVRAGDDAAFDVMFARFAAPLAAYAYGFVGTRTVAEDIVQDVFLRVWTQRATWDVHGTVQAYLHAMVRGRALDHLKHERVRDRWHARGVVLSGELVAPQRPDQIVERDDEAARIRAAMAELSVRVREALALRWHGGMSYAEIAAVMHTSVKTVENQLAKGLRHLRERLGDEVR